MLLDIYWQTLAPFPLDHIRAALKSHLLDPDVGQFMPKPADVLQLLQGKNATKAIQAWTKVLNAIRTVGQYDSIVFDDPLIHAAILDLGGWGKLCRSDARSLVFIGQQFEKIYRAYLQQRPTHYPKQLTGYFENQNNFQENAAQTIRFLGDKAKAMQIWQHGCEPKDYLRLSHEALLKRTPLNPTLPDLSEKAESRSNQQASFSLTKQPGKISNEQG